MALTLRPYQETCVDQVIAHFEGGHKSVLLWASVAAGKTAMASHLQSLFLEAGSPSLFTVTFDALIEQTLKSLRSVDIPEDQIGIIRGGTPEHRDRPIQIASQQTLCRRDWWKRRPWGLVVEDECHLSSFTATGRAVRAALPRTRFLGLTGSPWRLSKREGFDHYSQQVNAPPPLWLMEQGYLSPLRYYGLSSGAPDLTGVRTIAGDWAQDELANRCTDPQAIAAAVANWRRHAEGMSTAAFCVTIAHARAVAAAFEAEGIPSAVVVGDTPRVERERIYAQLDRKEILVLCSVMALGVGWDLPSCQVGLLLRPTKSRSLSIQLCGRIARKHHTKEHGLILDCTGVNIQRHGFLEDLPADLRRQMPQEPNGGGGGAQVKLCPPAEGGCEAMLPTFTQECPHCGHDFRKAVPVNTGPLVELVSKADALAKEPPESRLKAQFHKLRKTAYQRGLMPGWAWHRFKEAAGREPKAEWFVGSTFRNPTPASMTSYATYLALMADRRGIDGRSAFIISEMNKEFSGLRWQAVVDVNEL